ncbi:MAG: hypothetical protein FD147_995 [Chloroflexi bacterium]|nr:MAG: hypothetical protein FD147_995 [Chloroflexota bacterium]
MKVRTTGGEIGWIQTGEQKGVQIDFDCKSMPSSSYRPINGTILADRCFNKFSLTSLSVENNSKTDAVIILTSLEGTIELAFFVQAGHDYRESGIHFGDYYEQLTEPLSEETGASIKIEIGTVSDEQADSLKIDPNSFPLIEGCKKAT